MARSMARVAAGDMEKGFETPFHTPCEFISQSFAKEFQTPSPYSGVDEIFEEGRSFGFGMTKGLSLCHVDNVAYEGQKNRASFFPSRSLRASVQNLGIEDFNKKTRRSQRIA